MLHLFIVCILYLLPASAAFSSFQARTPHDFYFILYFTPHSISLLAIHTGIPKYTLKSAPTTRHTHSHEVYCGIWKRETGLVAVRNLSLGGEKLKERLILCKHTCLPVSCKNLYDCCRTVDLGTEGQRMRHEKRIFFLF